MAVKMSFNINILGNIYERKKCHHDSFLINNFEKDSLHFNEIVQWCDKLICWSTNFPCKVSINMRFLFQHA